MSNLLSICIPTYMRCRNVENLLKHLVPICKDRNIQICISDNASVDDTEVVCKQYLEKYENFLYTKQNFNTISDNFFHAIEKANGEYVWLLGDNDWPTENLIDKVLELCEERKYASIVLHEFLHDYSGKSLNNAYIQLCENKIYQSNEYNILLEELGCGMHLISNVVIERNAWNITIDDYMLFKQFFPNSEHIGIEFKYLIESGKPSYFLYDFTLEVKDVIPSNYPLDYIPVDNYNLIYKNIRRVRNWYDMFSNFERAFENLQAYGYSYESVKKALQKREITDIRLSKCYRLFPLMHLKAQSIDDYKTILNDLHFVKRSLWDYINIFISKIIPIRFCKSSYALYKKIKM